ncbi:Di-sulfide bridge nucleocytoplasmic transport domain-containing protein [Parasitella parasitica]|nr:Di-sulfide bridge nucleocytoplasmic transport domain-containing protein [Parasitella parasitica]
MAGSKRIRIENDAQSIDFGNIDRLALKDFKFDFTPTAQTHSKTLDRNLLIDTSAPSVGLNPNVLTQRFVSRSKKFWRESKDLKATASSVSTVKPPYEPVYLRHQDISDTVIVYVQMIFNIIVSATFLYIFINVMLTVRQDFRLKAVERIQELYKEKMICSNNYNMNQCGHDDRIPAIEDMCNEWASCMNREVVVPQAQASAEAIAEIINSFVEPISYKTFFFSSFLMLGVVVFSNLGFGILRRNYKSIRAIQ